MQIMNFGASRMAAPRFGNANPQEEWRKKLSGILSNAYTAFSASKKDETLHMAVYAPDPAAARKKLEQMKLPVYGVDQLREDHMYLRSKFPLSKLPEVAALAEVTHISKGLPMGSDPWPGPVAPKDQRQPDKK